MKIDEIISKKIDVEVDILKTYVLVLMGLSAGLYVLSININEHQINKTLFVLGLLIFIALICAIVYSYIKIKIFFKQLKK